MIPPSVARISGWTLTFLSAPLLALSLYGILASQMPPSLEPFLDIGAACGGLGLIQAMNRIASYFPQRVATCIHWVHSLTFELFAFIAVFCLRPLHYLPGYRSATGAREGRPILLIHGYMHNSSAWAYLKGWLSQEGIGPIYCLNLGYPFRPIRDFAEKVRQKAEQIEQETKRSDLILIGHSMGGLIAAWYATQCAPGKVTDVITIGSPLAGTHMAKIGLGPNAREMECQSEFLKEFQQAIQKNTFTRFYHIGTKTDQIIIPHRSSILEGSLERQFIVEDIGHLSLLFSSRVARRIHSWLTSSQLIG